MEWKCISVRPQNQHCRFKKQLTEVEQQSPTQKLFAIKDSKKSVSLVLKWGCKIELPAKQSMPGKSEHFTLNLQRETNKIMSDLIKPGKLADNFTPDL